MSNDDWHDWDRVFFSVGLGAIIGATILPAVVVGIAMIIVALGG